MKTPSRTLKNLLLVAIILLPFESAFCQKTHFLTALFKKTPAIQTKIALSADAPLYPLTDLNAVSAQSLASKKLAHPEINFDKFFKQMVYLPQNYSVIEKMDRGYFPSMHSLLSTAANVTLKEGYPVLYAYLKLNKGQMPTLAADGSAQSTPEVQKMLTFYASEELNNLLEKVLARPEGKQQLSQDEWIVINVLSTMLPDKTRPVFYELLLEKKYQELRIISLDPYMQNPASLRIAAGKTLPQDLTVPTKKERIDAREQQLKDLLTDIDQLKGIYISYLKNYSAAEISYKLSAAKSPLSSENKLKNNLTQAQALYENCKYQLDNLYHRAMQIQKEIHFLEGNGYK